MSTGRDLQMMRVRHMRLKDVGEIKSGKPHSVYGVGNVPVYMSGGVVAHIDTAMDEGPAVIVPIRDSIEKQYFVSAGTPFFCGATCVYIKCRKDVMDARFLFHLLQSERLERLNASSTVPSLPREKLANMLIFVPPLAYQRGAVRTLDSMLMAIKGIEEAMQRIGDIGQCEREDVFKLLDRGREPARRQGGAAQMLLSL